MTVVDASMRTGLREAATGVERLPGVSLDPVVIAASPAGMDPAIAVALPLLARRRRVFVAEAYVAPGELPDSFALIVAPGGESHIAADAQLSALIVFGAAVPVLGCPALVIAPNGSSANYPGSADVRFAEAGHPAEQAHLIDAFLREPRRYAAHSMIPRARP